MPSMMCLGGGLEEFSIPSAVALVTNGERDIYLNSFGMLGSESKKPMTSDAIFRIASMTKPITSIGVMQLLESGKIGLDDPISEHSIELPQFEIFDRSKERLKIIYLSPQIPNEYSEDLKFFKDNYLI